MALVEKNENLNGRAVRMENGLVVSWGDGDEDENTQPSELLEYEEPKGRKTLRTKNEEQKTKKVVI